MDKLNYILIKLIMIFVIGILIWYPIPYLRKVPINIAKYLSVLTESYRWFAVFYLILVFVLTPAFIFGLSVAGT
jgi:sodium-dependent phosphate cotransporter